jgi:hypothetical protein
MEEELKSPFQQPNEEFLDALREAMAAKMFSGKPDRYLPINDDDVMNVKIALNTTCDVNEFVAAV